MLTRWLRCLFALFLLILVAVPSFAQVQNLNVYENFEGGVNGQSITPATLNAGLACDNAGGTWTLLGNAGTQMQFSTAAEQPLPGAVTACGKVFNPPDGTLGVTYNLNTSSGGYAKYTWTATSNNASLGAWFKTDLPTSDTNYHSMLLISDGTGDYVALMIHSANFYIETGANPNGQPNVGSFFPYTANKWYWVTQQFQTFVNSSSMHSMAIYDCGTPQAPILPCNLLSLQKKSTASFGTVRPNFFAVGKGGDTGTPANLVYYDNLLGDTTGQTFPILPTSGPVISSLSQSAGSVGTPITITGNNFGASQGGSTVTFNGTAASPTGWGATSIGVPVPAGATTGNVVVTVTGASSNGVPFTVTSSPFITGLSPGAGPVGTQVTISGANFGSSPGSVAFNGTPANPSSWSGTSIVVPVPAGATTGNLVVTAGGVASNAVPFTVNSGNIALVQHTSRDAGSTTSNTLAFTSPNTAGNWIAVAIRVGASSSQVFSVSDTNGNTYHQAFQLGVTGNPITLAIYYAENIKAGANTVTVSDTVSGPFRTAILEYSGVATSNSLDGTATGQGTSTSPLTGNASTTANGDLLLGEVVTNSAATFTAGSGYTIEESVPGEPNSKLIAEDQIQAAAGMASAGATLAASDNWGAGLAAFKAAGGGGGGAPPPSISSLSPLSGAVGAPVTISGANFGASQGTSTVTFNGTAATPTSWSAGSIMAPVPAGATSGNVVVTVSGVASNGVAFTVTNSGSPSISTLSLTQGPVGAAVTITGSNFGASQGPSTVTFNGTVATASNWSDTSINVTVPSGATTGNVVVTVGGVASNGVQFTVTPPPNISSINPTSGPVGASILITGSNFGNTVGTISSFVTFNGTQTRTSNWSNASITAPVPVGATSGNVVVSVGGVPSNGVPFAVTPPPSISSLNPTSGPVGTSVTISGANFGASQQSSTVTFNGTAGAPSSWTDTSIVVPVPSGATPGNVVVSIGGIASNGVNFTVTSNTGNISLVQHTRMDAGVATTTSLAFVSPNAAGNWIAVIIRAGAPSAQTFTVTDSNGNTYQQALQLGIAANPFMLAIYYAENIKAGANTVTVTDTVSGTLRIAILEYTGVAQAHSLELTVTAQGTSTAPNSGNLTTTSSGDLLLGEVVTNSAATFTAGSGYAVEESVPAEPNTKLIEEDQLQRTGGTASASATLAASDNWGAGLAAFRSISGAGLPLSVSVSPTTANVDTGFGTQNFTATLVNDFDHQGVTWSIAGSGCSGSTCGTLTNVTTTSVTYNGPANVPSPATVTLTATAIADNTKTATATITVIQGPPNVTVSPKRAAVPMSASQTAQFIATVSNDPSNAGVTWQVDVINGGTPASGMVSATGLFTPGTQPGVHTVTAVSNANASVSASATVAVTDLTGVYMHHNDIQRTGQNLQEYGLTTSTVNSSTFGALFSCPVDGYLWAAPLWVANLAIGGQTRNVVYVATSHDSVYAFDADSPSCTQLWTVSFLSNGISTVAPADVNDGANDMFPEIGITSTPVIDPATNTIYVEAKTKDTVSAGCSAASPCYFHRLHALNLITGAEKFGGPVQITTANFDSRIHHQRPALLLDNGTVYLGFGSHGDRNSYQGWLFGYNASTLAQQFVTRLTTSAGNRGAVWGAGAGPAADANGNVYISTGNGVYDGTSNFADTSVKLSPTGGILDWFTPFDEATFEANDIDLGSSGVIILPDSVGSAMHQHLALVTGKVSILYLVDQTNMGKFTCSTCSNNDVQEVTPVPPPNTTQLDGGLFGSPAYWNGNLYTTGVHFPLSQFHIANGTISTPQFKESSNSFPLRGATPVVSASGTTNGIVWILDLTGWSSNNPAILDAYDATDVSTLLYSSPASGAGAAPPAVKFTIPTVANGKVYVPGEFKFTVFGLLPN